MNPGNRHSEGYIMSKGRDTRGRASGKSSKDGEGKDRGGSVRDVCKVEPCLTSSQGTPVANAREAWLVNKLRVRSVRGLPACLPACVRAMRLPPTHGCPGRKGQYYEI